MPLLKQDQRAMPMRKHIHADMPQAKQDNRAMPLRKQEAGAVTTTANTVAAEMNRMRGMPM